jgi:PAS domain S-box-containing protein
METTVLFLFSMVLVLAAAFYRYQLLKREPIFHHKVFQNIPVALIIVNQQSAILDINAAARKIKGHTPNEVLGKKLDEIFPEVAQNPGQEVLIAQQYYRINQETISRNNTPIAQLFMMTNIEHEKRAEQASRYQNSLLANMSEAVIVTDLDFRIQGWNGAAEKIYGWTEAEVLQKLAPEVLQTQFATEAERQVALRELMTNGLFFSEVQQRHKDGRTLTILGSINMVKNEHGQAIGIIAVNRDISQRKRMEEELRRSEEKFSKIFHSSPIPMVVSTTGTHPIYVDANRAYLNLIAFEWSEIEGHSLVDLGIAINDEEHSERMRSLAQSRAYKTQGARIRVRSGEIRDVLITAERVWIGEQECDIELLMDISEQKAIEKALLESEERYRSLFEQSNDAIFIINLQAELLAVNRRAARLLGYEMQELIGLDISKTDVTNAYPESISILASLFAGKEVAPYERDFLRKDGSVFPAEINATLVRDTHGQPLYVQSIVRDISKEREAAIFRQEQQHLLEVLLDIMGVLNSTLEFNRVLELILSNVGRVVPHDAASVMLIENNVARIVRAISHNSRLSIDELIGEEFQLSTTKTLSTMMQEALPYAVSDIRSFPDWVVKEPLHWVQSYLGMPILVDGKVIGFLNLYSTEANFYQDRQNERLQLFSSKIALAIKNAHFHEQAQALAAANERQRLARELHDAVSQTLFSATLIAETLPQLAERDITLVKEGLRELVVLTKGAFSEMRLLLLELRPAALLETPFPLLLSNLRNALQARLDADLEFELAIDNLQLDDNVKIGLYRIMQETLNNIVKHSRAHHVSFKLRCQEDSLELRIVDDGQGFDVNLVQAHQLGLGIMRERAADLGFVLEIKSQPQQGTSIYVCAKTN